MERRGYSTTVELALRATPRCTQKGRSGAGPERPIVVATRAYSRDAGVLVKGVMCFTTVVLFRAVTQVCPQWAQV